ncbi:uncharacterized protein RAG0_12684 [Rhynchosporium agropyri]|uniref:Uncharacterized protein n=1 Tax=Rhynchosporium agropyri TaxID=914238 RepID=A0A1E1L965_9HELO|nr:uncharacterized protein RAG0_12684 [Rhynchosporium agropyri]
MDLGLYGYGTRGGENGNEDKAKMRGFVLVLTFAK